MAKHTQTIRRQQSTNCLSVFDHFVGLCQWSFSILHEDRKNLHVQNVGWSWSELISETYLGLCQTSTMEFFIETSWQLLVDIYFRKESSVTIFPAGFLCFWIWPISLLFSVSSLVANGRKRTKKPKHLELWILYQGLIWLVFIKFLFFHQMIALQKLWEMFFISSKKLSRFKRTSGSRIIEISCIGLHRCVGVIFGITQKPLYVTPSNLAR